MTALDFLRFALLVTGLVYLLCTSLIFSPLRRGLVKLTEMAVIVYCPTCSSFWIGFVLSIMGLSPFGVRPQWYEVIETGIFAVAITTVWVQLLYHGVNPAYLAEQAGGHRAPEAKETEDG